MLRNRPLSGQDLRIGFAGGKIPAVGVHTPEQSGQKEPTRFAHLAGVFFRQKPAERERVYCGFGAV